MPAFDMRRPILPPLRHLSPPATGQIARATPGTGKVRGVSGSCPQRIEPRNADACRRLDTDQMLSSAGVDRATVQDPDGRIPTEQVQSLWRKAYELSMDLDLARCLSERIESSISVTAAQPEVCPAGAARGRGPDVSARGVASGAVNRRVPRGKCALGWGARVG
jgi:hypothetical protein